MTETVEFVRDNYPRGPFGAVVFDFDGTLSLVRRDWQGIMIALGVDHLAATGTEESREELGELVEEFVMRLNGRPTIDQMHALRDEVTARGGTPQDSADYKTLFVDRLLKEVDARIASIEQGTATQDDWTVPGARGLLQTLQDRQTPLFLATGTDLHHVKRELNAIGLDHFFGRHVYGPTSDNDGFSKGKILDMVLAELSLTGEQVVGFGDGVVEIQELKRRGALAVGVASDEVRRQGVNAWKREQLLRAGADIIIADYRPQEQILELLQLT